MKKAVVYVLVFVIGLLAGLLGVLPPWRRTAGPSPATGAVVRTDTLFLHDTVTIRLPAPAAERITDTIVLHSHSVDTLLVRDTVWSLPKTQRSYRGERYAAWVSGYDPVLDSVKVFCGKQLVTSYSPAPSPVRPRRWGLSVQTGWGVSSTGGGVRLGPYIGVGVSYSLLQW